MADYDHETPVYDLKRFSSKGGRYIDLVEKKLLARVASGPLLLEIGVATGRFIPFVHSLGWNYTGLDISRKMLDRAVEHDPELIQADGETVPIRESSIDSIICLHTFHFLPEPMNALDEFHRILKPEGCLFLIFEMDTWLRRLWLRILAPPSNQFYFKIGEVAEMATREGFEIFAQGQVLKLPMEAYRKLPMTRVQRAIDTSRLWPTFFATLGFVAARKIRV